MVGGESIGGKLLYVQVVTRRGTIDQHKTVPVKLTDVSIGKGTISLTVEPLKAADREAALKAIREPYDSATAKND